MQHAASKVGPIAALLGALLAAAAAGCDGATEGRSEPHPGAALAPCEGPAPACLTNCVEATTVDTAICLGSRWSCERGVNERLCCDAATSPETCPTWNDACETVWGCPSGYTCVKSRNYPVPADSGICRLGELTVPDDVAGCSRQGLTPPALLPLMGPGVAKIDGLVVIEYKCEDKACADDDPCCQQCLGSYRLSLGIDNEFGKPLVLPIRTESLSCLGTNCGFTCAPMQPGRQYRIWGSYLPSAVAGGAGTLYHVGHCAL